MNTGDLQANDIGSGHDRNSIPMCKEVFFYFDTTLNKPIWWTGTSCRLSSLTFKQQQYERLQ